MDGNLNVEFERNSKRELRDNEELHRILADNALDVIWAMGPDGSILYVSPSVFKLRGVTPDEAKQQTLAEILTPESQLIVTTYQQRLFADINSGHTPEKFQAELEYVHKDGSIIWTEVMAYPVLDSNGRLKEIVGSK